LGETHVGTERAVFGTGFIDRKLAALRPAKKKC
jgi:hypothetical protein